ncbi:rod-determining factor RdfA [Haloarchaeobius salinus]|uniref:rod-determining factor RdfA n=1 Tax=Haloarchaeobius salinus TaxID=1198298 RepID=UPI00210D8C58|nr:rod-determining factor RdfA [Haloarchaeobius salinus]
MVERENCGCKVGRVTAEYGRSDVDDWLTAEWQDGTSVRSLTETLNRDLVEAELTAVDVSRFEWSRTPVYEALHTDELAESEVIEIRRELDRAGVDVEQLADRLVSHQTVYRHLTNCLEASGPDEKTTTERSEQARDRIYALQQRTSLVTESTLESLQNAGVTDVGDPEVLVDVRIVCRDCGRSMDLERVLTDGCDCPSE